MPYIFIEQPHESFHLNIPSYVRDAKCEGGYVAHSYGRHFVPLSTRSKRCYGLEVNIPEKEIFCKGSIVDIQRQIEEKQPRKYRRDIFRHITRAFIMA